MRAQALCPTVREGRHRRSHRLARAALLPAADAVDASAAAGEEKACKEKDWVRGWMLVRRGGGRQWFAETQRLDLGVTGRKLTDGAHAQGRWPNHGIRPHQSEGG